MDEGGEEVYKRQILPNLVFFQNKNLDLGLGGKRFLIFLCTHDDVADRRRRGVTRGIMGPEPG